MDNNIKSLENYIEQCIDEFNFNDFAPPISHNALSLRFTEILHKENAYWSQVKPKDTWDRWVFIQFKTFVNALRPSILGLNFEHNKVIFILTKEISFNNLYDKNKQTEIDIFDIWLDHSKLTKAFCTFIKKGIKESNNASL